MPRRTSKSGDVSLEPLLNQNIVFQPLTGFAISDQEVIPNGISYYGYLRNDGAWYIMKSTDVGSETNYTYAAATGSYDWSNRTLETYAAYSTTFAV